MEDEIEAGGEAIEPTETAAPATQEVADGSTAGVKAEEAKAVAEILAGGQKFRDVGHLGDTYGKLLGEYTRGQQERSKLRKDYEEFKSVVEEIKRIPGAVKAIQEYMASRGTQPRAEQPDTRGGLTEEEDFRIAKIELENEASKLQKKYPDCTEEVLMEVYAAARDLAEQHGIRVPLDYAYKQVMFDKRGVESYNKGVAAAKKEVTQAKPASTAQPQPSGEKKDPKFSGAKKFKDREEHILKLLSKKGVKLEEE